MKYFIVLVVLLAFPMASTAQQGSPSSRSGATIFRDSLRASEQWYTFRIDSTYLRGGGSRGDTTWYADPRIRAPKGQVKLQINVLSSNGRADTIRVMRLVRATYNAAIDAYDSVWVPVPIMDLATATTALTGIISIGPFYAPSWAEFYYGSFLLYDITGENGSWRIERVSGKGHPNYPDDSATHTLIFEFFRKDY
ncbi:MAG TPA: hypothetical protein PK916_08820 [Bacteroidota bacterium]|nr:hypothetical protein [Bacteroidota bacterium]